MRQRQCEVRMPQSSVLGLILFKIFIIDLNKDRDYILTMFKWEARWHSVESGIYAKDLYFIRLKLHELSITVTW